MSAESFMGECLKQSSEVYTIKGQIHKAFNTISEQAQSKGLSESFIDGMAAAACIFADCLGMEQIELSGEELRELRE